MPDAARQPAAGSTPAISIEREPTLEDAVGVALDALAACGVPAERVVLAVTDPYVKGVDTSYATHVGAVEDYDTAGLLAHIARDVHHEAHLQAVALVTTDESCPACGSQRWATKSRRDHKCKTAIRVVFWDECLSCGHRGPDR